MSKKGLEVFASRNILLKITCMRSETCVDCLISKQHKVAFQHLAPKENLVLWNWACLFVLYEFDKTVGGAFIDDFSNKMWCFAWKFKDQVFGSFKSFLVSVGREIRWKLKLFV